MPNPQSRAAQPHCQGAFRQTLSIDYHLVISHTKLACEGRNGPYTGRQARGAQDFSG